MIIAIDPGPEESALIAYTEGEIQVARILTNERCAEWLTTNQPFQELVIEMVACYGMPVGKEVFETCVWIGRFIQAWGRPYRFLYRREIKLHLCHSARAKDSNIRQALLDRFGGSKEKAIGRKAQPGPLYGISSHLWSALAVAVTYEETKDLQVPIPFPGKQVPAF